MFDLQLQYALSVSHPCGHYVPPCSHDKYEIVYYHTGYGTTKIGDTTYHFSPNTFVVIPPNTIHDETHTADGDLLFIQFTSPTEFPSGFFTDVNDIIYKIVKSILQECYDQPIFYKEMISLKLNELLIMLGRLAPREKQQPKPKSFKYIINYLEDNYHDRILLHQLAAQMNYSYDYFQHQFRKLTGHSPQQYLINKRIDAAKVLLTDPNLSCTEIAYRCGFSNSAQFSTIFKRALGITPNQYRKNIF